VTALDTARFKEALGHYATGVVVVTATTPEGLAGFTCQTFGSLSLEPMLVSFAATTRGASWGQVQRGTAVGISVLAADQEALARCFGQSGADKFAGVSYELGPLSSPLLDGAIAHLEGAIVSVATHGDHDIAVVAVTHVATHPGEPLIYYRGGFNVLEG
jgi:3-hydroxy-9,10-secoandrosta-1,3,5(10)-triene-9,17-dione monooxygenase reductase component